MDRKTARQAVGVATVAAFLAGCGAAPATDDTVVSGRRVQSAQVRAQGAVPYQLNAYELEFADGRGPGAHARRAALAVDFVGAQGYVRGFAEWGRAGEAPETYAVGGWARQRTFDGKVVTVFDLALNQIHAHSRRGQSFAPGAVRVLVNEASGDVTLSARR